MRTEEFKAMVIRMLDYYQWRDDQVLRKAMEKPKFLAAFLHRCEREEDRYCICFSDAVYYRIPREIIKLRGNNIKIR